VATPHSAALPSAATPDSAALPSAGTPDSADPAGAGPAADLPDVSLPCFTGGSPVRLTALRGPAVINLWGSWCGPCREELPVMQALSDATAGRLRVIGVDTRDSRDAGASFAAGQGVSFPTLFDPDQQLLTALGKVALPVTVFIAADGSRELYTGKALDKPTLGALVRTHTGVTVTG
jgi:thiol-disulfide isomerase/thioredoxin